MTATVRGLVGFGAVCELCGLSEIRLRELVTASFAILHRCVSVRRQRGVANSSF